VEKQLTKERQTEIEAVGKREEESSLKGTFMSVMLLGAFILISWVAVFLLFIERQ